MVRPWSKKAGCCVEEEKTLVGQNKAKNKHYLEIDWKCQQGKK